MKRKYEKPAIYVERFELTQNIAGDCSPGLDLGMAAFGDKDTCAWNMGGVEVFLAELVCANATREAEGFCYDNPFGGLTVFSS